jgi:hypothetical protein
LNFGSDFLSYWDACFSSFNSVNVVDGMTDFYMLGHLHLSEVPLAGSQWLIPVILATHEAEIKASPINCKTLSQKDRLQKWAGTVVQVVESLPSK